MGKERQFFVRLNTLNKKNVLYKSDFQDKNKREEIINLNVYVNHLP